MSEPTPIDPARFFEFIDSPGLVVLLVSVHPAHTFNQALCRHLHDEHGDQVAFGTLDLADLLVSGGNVLQFLHQALQGRKAPSSFGVLPGYWLFQQGELLAWDSGLPTLSDVKGLARSALLGAVFSGIARDWAFVGQALQLATEELTAQRITGVFRQAVADHDPKQRRAPPPPRPDSSNELFWAYQVLGVLPSATDQEVQEAWRKRRVDNHPDRAGQDPVEFQRRSRISADINRARDIILKHRGRRKRATA